MSSKHSIRRILLVAVTGLALGGVARADTINLFASKPDPLFQSAVTTLGRGDLKQADALFQQIAEKDPSQLRAALGRAQIAVLEQRLADADRVVSGTLAKSPNLPAAHNMKGLVLMLQKRPDEARKAFMRAVELDPKYVAPRIYMASMLRTSGRYSRPPVSFRDSPSVAA